MSVHVAAAIVTFQFSSPREEAPDSHDGLEIIFHRPLDVLVKIEFAVRSQMSLRLFPTEGK